MKSIKLSRTIVIIFILCSCRSSKSVAVDKIALSSCDNLPNIKFQNAEDTIDIEKVAKFATDLKVAAEADISKMVDVPSKANGSVEIKSEFGKKVNEKLIAQSKVSEEFWQQNIVFTQSLCFLERQSNRKDISKEIREQIIRDMNALAIARSKYSTEFQKKNGSSPN